MIDVTVVVMLRLMILHSASGELIEVNPHHVTSMRGPRKDEQAQYFTGNVHCLINLTDGKFVAVAEDCDTVEKLFEEAKQ